MLLRCLVKGVYFFRFLGRVILRVPSRKVSRVLN